MGIPALYSEPDPLAQLRSGAGSFGSQMAPHSGTISGFYNSAKFSNVLTYDWCTCMHITFFNVITLNLIISLKTIILHYVWGKNMKQYYTCVLNVLFISNTVN